MRRSHRTQVALAILYGFWGVVTAARGAPLYWVGPAGGNWSDAANWSLASGGAGGDGPPTAADTAVFDGGKTNSASLDAAFAGTVGAVLVADGYTGTVTQRRDLDVGGDFDLFGGVWTFAAGTPAALDVDGDLTVAAELRCPYSSLAGEGTGRVFTVGQSLTVAANGWINADGMGFPAGQGPGRSPLDRGMAHGGRGGRYGATGVTYGSMVDPVSLGSGSAYAPGGGAVKIIAGSTMTIDGIISANGTPGPRGGPAGGSINLSGSVLSGLGTIQANGARCTDSRGGGGGGRISLNGVATDTFTGILQADGSSIGSRGFAGTIHSNPAKRANLVLGGTGNWSTLRLGSDDSHDYTFGTIVIQAGGVLEIDGNPSLNNGEGSAATLTATSITIEPGGVLRADGLGFAAGFGPGAEALDYGGTHGGLGGFNAIKPSYGSFTNPVSLGSGGGSAGGGGAIILAVSGTITVNGVMSANGAVWNRGGGAGGTINLTCGTLAGTNAITANGGHCTSNRGGGGGGRISLNGVTTDNFTGSLQANGAALGMRGHAGSIYLNVARRANLTLGGAENLSALRLGTDRVNNYEFGSVTIQDQGTLEVDGHPLMNNGQGSAATIRMASLDIHAGGSLHADTLGFIEWKGPGCAVNWDQGASYGGQGGYAYSGHPPTYGSLTAPISLGSGGGAAKGGGALILEVGGEVTVNGRMSADGEAGGRAGGAGGTINLTCAALAGTNTIRAAGGTPTTGDRGGGGGGRIAVRLTNATDFAEVVWVARGGSSSSLARRGGAGTVYLESLAGEPGRGTLIVDNGTVSASVCATVIGPLVTNTAVGDVILRNLARLMLDTNQSLAVYGCWSNAATFVAASNSVVNLSGSAPAAVYGDNTFWSLVATNAGKTVTFESGRTNTVRGHLALRGVVLKATNPGVQTWLTLDPVSGTQDIGGVVVGDNNASLGATLVAGCKPRQSVDAGNTDNWEFPGAPGTVLLVR